jgi:hypothetical protein
LLTTRGDLALTMLRNSAFNGETMRLDGAVRTPPP